MREDLNLQRVVGQCGLDRPARPLARVLAQRAVARAWRINEDALKGEGLARAADGRRHVATRVGARDNRRRARLRPEATERALGAGPLHVVGDEHAARGRGARAISAHHVEQLARLRAGRATQVEHAVGRAHGCEECGRQHGSRLLLAELASGRRAPDELGEGRRAGRRRRALSRRQRCRAGRELQPAHAVQPGDGRQRGTRGTRGALDVGGGDVRRRGCEVEAHAERQRQEKPIARRVPLRRRAQPLRAVKVAERERARARRKRSTRARCARRAGVVGVVVLLVVERDDHPSGRTALRRRHASRRRHERDDVARVQHVRARPAHVVHEQPAVARGLVGLRARIAALDELLAEGARGETLQSLTRVLRAHHLAHAARACKRRHVPAILGPVRGSERSRAWEWDVLALAVTNQSRRRRPRGRGEGEAARGG